MEIILSKYKRSHIKDFHVIHLTQTQQVRSTRGRTGEDPVNADILTFGGENIFMLFLYSSLCLIIQWILIIYLFLKRYTIFIVKLKLFCHETFGLIFDNENW